MVVRTLFVITFLLNRQLLHTKIFTHIILLQISYSSDLIIRNQFLSKREIIWLMRRYYGCFCLVAEWCLEGIWLVQQTKGPAQCDLMTTKDGLLFPSFVNKPKLDVINIYNPHTRVWNILLKANSNSFFQLRKEMVKVT